MFAEMGGQLLTAFIGNRLGQQNVNKAHDILGGITGQPLPRASGTSTGTSGSGGWWLGKNWGRPNPKATAAAPVPAATDQPPAEPYRPYVDESPLGYEQNQVQPYTDPAVWQGARGGQGFSFEGQQVRPGENTVDLSRYFAPVGSVTDAYRAGYGAGYDWSGLKGQVAEILQGARLDPNSAASTVGGMFADPSVDAFKRNAVNDITSASRQRTANARQELVGRALASGASLEQVQDQLRMMDLQEGRARSGQVAGVESAAEELTNRTNLARAGAAAGAFGQAQDINQNLSRTAAGALTELGGAEAGQFLQHARDLSANTGWDINATSQGRGAAWDASQMIGGQNLEDIARSAGLTVEEARLALQTIFNAQSAGAGYQAGLNVLAPDLATPVANWNSNRAAERAYNDDGGMGFGFGIDGSGTPNLSFGW